MTTTFAKGWRLPDALLPRVGSAGTVRLHDPREPTVLVLCHEAPGAGLAAWVRGLVDRPSTFGAWGGRLLVVLPPRRADASSAIATDAAADVVGALLGAAAAAPFPAAIAIDADARLGTGAAPGATVLLIVDAWGEVYHAERLPAAGGGPAASEVEGWLRYVATQCPECEGPEGGWRDVRL
jgi:hypothetical protein